MHRHMSTRSSGTVRGRSFEMSSSPPPPPNHQHHFDEGRRGAKKNQLFYVFQKASGIRLWDLTKKRGKRGERKECAGFCSEFYIDLDEMQFCSGAKVHIKLDLRGVFGRWKVRIGCVG